MMTPEQALTILRLSRAMDMLFELWQKTPTAADNEPGKLYDRVEALLGKELAVAESTYSPSQK